MEEIVRLRRLLHAIPCGHGYDSVLLFVFWVPRDAQYEAFRAKVLSTVSCLYGSFESKIYHVFIFPQMNDSLIDDDIKAHIRQSTVLLLSSAGAADEGFSAAIEQVTFDVTGHRGSVLNIEGQYHARLTFSKSHQTRFRTHLDIVEPFAAAWSYTLNRGMRLVCPRPDKSQ